MRAERTQMSRGNNPSLSGAPTTCAACAELIKESNLHWVQCGGLSVGMERNPLVWRLRDKDELLAVQQRTKDLQKLAAAMRYLSESLPHLPPELAEKVAKFCNAPVKPSAR